MLLETAIWRTARGIRVNPRPCELTRKNSRNFPNCEQIERNFRVICRAFGILISENLVRAREKNGAREFFHLADSLS